jgi:hypothetical protein
VSLRGRHPNPSKPPVSVMNVSYNGRLMASVRPMVNAGLLDRTAAADYFKSAGWSGSADWPWHLATPGLTGELEQTLRVLRWLAGHLPR